MERVLITEEDTTSSAPTYSTTDVVFVPGFSLAPLPPQESVADVLNGDTSEYGAPVGVPILCKDLATFDAYFKGRVAGKETPYFVDDQRYPYTKNPTTSRLTLKFEKDAIPFPIDATIDITTLTDETKVPVMYKAGEPDPAYVFARELVSAGFPVLYMRLNKYNTEAEVTAYNTEHASDSDFVPAVFDICVINYEDTTVGTKTTAAGTVGYYPYLEDVVYTETPNEILMDRGENQFKYATSGGYPTFEYDGNAISKNMLKLCAFRGDAAALIDPTINPARDIKASSSHSVYHAVQDAFTDYSEYGSMFFPWHRFSTRNSYSVTDSDLPESPTVWSGYENFPLSFGFFNNYIKSLRTNPSGLAIAGIARGSLVGSPAPILNSVLTNSIANSYQGEDVSDGYNVSINPSTKIGQYGQVILGNRTLKSNSPDGLTATSFWNIRLVLCDIKKKIYTSCMELLYEQNNDVLWTKLQSKIMPLLDNLVSNQILKNYLFLKNKVTDNSGNSLKKNKLSFKLFLDFNYAVEGMDIRIVITDDDAVVVSE